MLFYLGDGEQTEEEKPKSFSPIKKYIKVAQSPAMARALVVRCTAPFGAQNTNWIVKNLSRILVRAIIRRDALSKIDEANLKNIADQAGIKYIHRTKPGEIEEITEAIDVSQSFVKIRTHLHMMIFRGCLCH